MNSELASETRGSAEHFDCDVSVLGLGAMGTAMAKALVAGGKRVAVWNRSRSKAELLEEHGAYRCESAAEALLASPVSIVVLLDNNAVNDVLAAVDQEAVFRDRTIVNFTTCSQEESEALDRLIAAMGGQHVKAAIVSYPRNIGHPESYGIYTGAEVAMSRCKDLVEVLAPHSIVLPQEDAAALSVALHAYSFAAMTAFYEAIGSSKHLGMAPSSMARLVGDASRFFLADAIQDAIRRVEADDFDGDQARLDVHATAFEYLAGALRSQGANAPVFEAVCEATNRASEMGYGDNDIAAMIKAYSC